MSETKRTPCPVCGKEGLEEFDFCPVCGWCNDINQMLHPDMEGGGNHMSLTEAKRAWAEHRQIE